VIRWLQNLKDSWRNALAGGAICAGIGLAAFILSHGLTYSSYDLLFVPSKSRPPPEEVVILYMDDRSARELHQIGPENWDRGEHAKIVDRLTADGARVVVFDIVFSEPRSPETNAIFSRAIKKNGRVVLAASLNPQARSQIRANIAIGPVEELGDAAAGVGIAECDALKGEVARRYFLGNEFQPSLPWSAAVVAGAPITKTPNARPPDTWLKFYGPARTLLHISYCEIKDQPPGFFRDKCVFIGAMPKTLRAFEESDVFPTPHWRWGGELFPGVEVGATAFLNILRNDGFVAANDWAQAFAFLLTGLFLGTVIPLFRPWIAAGAAVLAIVICLIVTTRLAAHHIWFSWLIIAAVQSPTALLWSLRGHFQRLSFDREVLQRTLEETTKLVEATKTAAAAAKNSGLVIPDHTLVRRVGKGAYGEVWLARNAVGVYHAVKIMQRRLFPADEPYEREFRGIQKFMPISRTHAGLVHILHVGRNDDEKFFFCIMEAGDDETCGQRIDPDKYMPKSLGSEIERLGQIPPEECLRLGLALTEALAHLHAQKLIHRDIKPPNIIYVNGTPKFADIGLVTDIAGQGEDVSYLGTEGYIAPEGPGTASADVYSLGKVLYEASMGRDRRLFPEVPTAVLEQPRTALVRRLNEIVFKACESEPERRYKTASEMHADLLRLQGTLSSYS
jgi:CHASE2 domain-containing sensor protein